VGNVGRKLDIVAGSQLDGAPERTDLRVSIDEEYLMNAATREYV
jgi:hypothetical protein